MSRVILLQIKRTCYVLSWRQSLYSTDVWGEAGTYGESSEGIGGGRMLVRRCQNVQWLKWLFYDVGRRWEKQTLKVDRTAVVWFKAGLLADHSVVGRKGWSVWAEMLYIIVPLVQAEVCLWCASEQLELSLLVVTFADFLQCFLLQDIDLLQRRSAELESENAECHLTKQTVVQGCDFSHQIWL